MALNDIEWYDLKVLEMRRDVLVRRLRTERDYKQRCLMNDELDKVIDQIVKLSPEDSDATGDCRQ